MLHSILFIILLEQLGHRNSGLLAIGECRVMVVVQPCLFSSGRTVVKNPGSGLGDPTCQGLAP